MAVRAECEPAQIGRTLLALLRRSLAAWSVDGLGGARRFYIAGCFGYRGLTVDDGIGGECGQRAALPFLEGRMLVAAASTSGA